MRTLDDMDRVARTIGHVTGAKRGEMPEWSQRGSTFRRPDPPAPDPDFTLGLDLGQAADYTALAVIETREVESERRHDLRHLHRFPLRTGYPAIVDGVTALLRREPLASGHVRLVVDATGVGRPVVDLLFREDLSAAVIPVTITSGTAVTRDDRGGYGVPKRDLVSSLQVALQSEALRIADGLALGPVLRQEMAGFRVKISLATGHDSYGAGEDWRSAPHDDLVLAVALACWQASKPPVRAAIL